MKKDELSMSFSKLKKKKSMIIIIIKFSHFLNIILSPRLSSPVFLHLLPVGSGTIILIKSLGHC